MSEGPRIFGILATAAPVVATIRRGPSGWAQVGRWDVAADVFEPGAWFHGRLFPQKCDLSPDGRWLLYSAEKVGAEWPAGEIYEAVSRLPWLHALAAWEAGTTYTRGLHFTPSAGVCAAGEPDVGDTGPLLKRHGIGVTRAEQFAVERRRGWEEAPGTPPREEGGPWDEGRAVEMRKQQPGDAAGPWLHVEGRFAAMRSDRNWDAEVVYSLVEGGELRLLGEVQWAEWSAAGDLLVATEEGRLQRRHAADAFEPARAVEVADLAAMSINPQPPPPEALAW